MRKLLAMLAGLVGSMRRCAHYNRGSEVAGADISQQASRPVALLSECVAGLEEDRKKGRYDTICIKYAIAAASIFGDASLLQRCKTLLDEAPDEQFLVWHVAAGDTAKRRKDLVSRERDMPNDAEVAKRCPPCGNEEVQEMISQWAASSGYLGLCVKGRDDEALAMARSDVQVEEIAEAQAVLGRIDAACKTADRLPPFRRQLVLVVACIEASRQGSVQQSGELMAELRSIGLVRRQA